MATTSTDPTTRMMTSATDKHAMVFCDALCAFTHLRRRLMTAQDPYTERLRLLEQMEPA
jgi:hypothetical protein